VLEGTNAITSTSSFGIPALIAGVATAHDSMDDTALVYSAAIAASAPAGSFLRRSARVRDL
jgi:hypothetical protein